MIRHIVMWKFLPEAGGKTKVENLEDVKARLMALYERKDRGAAPHGDRARRFGHRYVIRHGAPDRIRFA